MAEPNVESVESPATSALQPATETVRPPETSTLTALPTLIPSPAIATSDDKVRFLARLMQNDADCRLPCWWSIKPGVTTVETAREMLEASGFTWNEDNSARMRAENVIVSIQLEVEDHIVQSVFVRSEDMSQFSPDRPFVFSELWKPYAPSVVLDNYGEPSEVFIYHPFQFDSGGGPAFHLVVVYEDLGIVIEYQGLAEYLGDQRYSACTGLEDISYLGMLLRQPGAGVDVIEQVIPFDSISHIAEREIAYQRISWEQATGDSLGSFYDALVAGNGNICFEFASR